MPGLGKADDLAVAAIDRKAHGPGDIGRTAIELGVDEIGDAAEEQADGRGNGEQVADLPVVGPGVKARPQDHGQHHTDETAVEGHAAIPDRDPGHRVAQIALRLPLQTVEQHRSQPPPGDHPDDDPEEQVVDRTRGDGFGARQARPDPKIAQHQTGDVSERIPADRDRADADQNRVDLRVGDFGQPRQSEARVGRHGGEESREHQALPFNCWQRCPLFYVDAVASGRHRRYMTRQDWRASRAAGPQH